MDENYVNTNIFLDESVPRIVKLTAEAYESLESKDASTIYIVG